MLICLLSSGMLMQMHELSDCLCRLCMETFHHRFSVTLCVISFREFRLLQIRENEIREKNEQKKVFLELYIFQNSLEMWIP